MLITPRLNVTHDHLDLPPNSSPSSPTRSASVLTSHLSSARSTPISSSSSSLADLRFAISGAGARNTGTPVPSSPSVSHFAGYHSRAGSRSPSPPPTCSSSSAIPIHPPASSSSFSFFSSSSNSTSTSVSTSTSTSTHLHIQPTPRIAAIELPKRKKQYAYAQFADIPGTRVGPDDGPWPKVYEVLQSEEEMWEELRRLGKPHRAVYLQKVGESEGQNEDGSPTNQDDGERGNEGKGVSENGDEDDRERGRDNLKGKTHSSNPAVTLRRKSSKSKSSGALLTLGGLGLALGAMAKATVEATGGQLLNPNSKSQRRVSQKPRPKKRDHAMVIDSINFQPSKSTRTQDRYVVTQLDVHGKIWTLCGVFDGHLGEVTVEHVAHHLPIIIRNFLRDNLPSASPNAIHEPAFITSLFQRAIASFDDAIAHDVLDLFGGSVDALEGWTDEEIRGVVNDRGFGAGAYGSLGGGGSNGAGAGGMNWRKARLCMYGTTALVALMDPQGEGLWVAGLGDCLGVLVTPTTSARPRASSKSPFSRKSKSASPIHSHKVQILTTTHNGDNPAEIARIKREHPGEENSCVVDGRVLGALAPTRCLGDVPFKQPPAFTRRILYNLWPYVHNTSPWEEFLVRNKTPPYISAEADVAYFKLHGDDGDEDGCYDDEDEGTEEADGQRRKRRKRYLILASDGFTDLCDGEGVENVVRSWAREMDEEVGCLGEQFLGADNGGDGCLTSTSTSPKNEGNAMNGADTGQSYVNTGMSVRISTSPRNGSHGLHQLMMQRSNSNSNGNGNGNGNERAISPDPISPTSPVPFRSSSFPYSSGAAFPASMDTGIGSTSSTSPPVSMSPSSFLVADPSYDASTSPDSSNKSPLIRPQHCRSNTNMALRLLRRVLGGEERSREKVGMVAGLDMDVSWIDDTALVVVEI